MSFSSLLMLSEGILVNMFCLSTRHHSDLSSPENARDGMELRWLLLISRLQAPAEWWWRWWRWK